MVLTKGSTSIGSGLGSLLKNKIRYLAIIANGVTNVDASIYELSTLRELAVRIGKTLLPGGIAKLGELTMLDLSFCGIKKLPDDLNLSRIKCLRLLRVTGIDDLLQDLPPELEILVVSACKLESVPESWLHSSTLRLIDLSQNHLREAPSNWTGVPNIEQIGLGRNRISKIPLLRFGKQNPKVIDLADNPILICDRSNLALIKNGIIIGTEE